MERAILELHDLKHLLSGPKPRTFFRRPAVERAMAPVVAMGLSSITGLKVKVLNLWFLYTILLWSSFRSSARMGSGWIDAIQTESIQGWWKSHSPPPPPPRNSTLSLIEAGAVQFCGLAPHLVASLL